MSNRGPAALSPPARLLRWLVEPAAHRPEAERRKAVMLAATQLLLTLVVAAALGAAAMARLVGRSVSGGTTTVAAGYCLLMLLAYGFNRLGRLGPSLALTLLTLNAGVWAAIAVNADRPQVNLLLLPLLVVAYLCNALMVGGPGYVALAAAHAAAAVLLQLTVLHLRPADFMGMMLFGGLSAGLVAAAAVVRSSDLRQIAAQSQALAESEQRFRHLFAFSPDAMLLLDPHDPGGQWPIVDCNDVACEMNGYERHELVGRSIDILNAQPGTPEQWAAYLERLRQEPVNHLEAVRRRKDGRLITVEMNASVILVGERELVLGIDRDMTERQTTTAALQEANSKLTTWLGELEQRTRELALLNDLGSLLQTCVTLNEANYLVGLLAGQFFPDESGALYLADENDGYLEVAASWGARPPGQTRFEPEACWALRRGQIHARPDGQSALPCLHLEEPPPEASLCVPMLAQGDTLGIFYLQSSPGRETGRTFGESGRLLAQTVADTIALALANLKLREKLRQQSIRDPLTSLYNRRYLEETLERELPRARRTEQPVGIILIDVDHFKRINDTWGHEAGDLALQTIGQFLMHHVRREDIPCRFGGEEFCLVLPGASLEDSRRRAEEMGQAVRHLHLQYGDQLLGVITLSMGVAVFPQHGLSREALLQAADMALYRAKGLGRNRVMTAGD